MTDQQTHLTDEQFSDLLLGINPEPVAEHVSACAQCSQEVDRIATSIGSFEQQTRLWAERRAAASPALIGHSHPVFPLLHRPQLWTAAALTIALAAGVSIRHERPAVVSQPVASVHPLAPMAAASTIKQDNELLSAIDGELRADDSTVDQYGLASGPGVRTRTSRRIAN